MEQLPILILVLTLVIGFACVGIISRLAYEKPSRVLKAFSNAILAYNMAMFIWFLMQYFVVNLGKDLSQLVFFFILQALTFLDAIFMLVWAYFYFYFLCELQGNEIFNWLKKNIKNIIYGFSILLFISFLITLFTVRYQILYFMKDIIISLNLVAAIVSTGYLFLITIKKGENEKNRAIIVFSASFCIIFLLFMIHKLFFYFFVNRFLSQLSEVIIELIVSIVSVIWVIWAADFFKEERSNGTILPKFESISSEEGKFTDRELEILNLLCIGKSNQDIADSLFISIKTVKSHVYNIFQKTKVKNRTQLARLFTNKSPE